MNNILKRGIVKMHFLSRAVSYKLASINQGILKGLVTLVITVIIVLPVILLPSLAMALQLNELVIERSGSELQGIIIVDDIKREQRELNVVIPSAADYESQGIAYNNFIRDLGIRYASSNRRSGRITISFPYEPIERFDLLIEVKWPAGEFQRRYRVNLAGILPQKDGSVIARITPVGVPVRRDSSATATSEEPPTATIETVEGDSWHNLAQAIRQAYLRDDGISREQVMVALRDKNQEEFINGRRVRIGVALNLPTYYEVDTVNKQEAQREIYKLLRQARRPSPRLEIVAAKSAVKSSNVVTLDSQNQDASAQDSQVIDDDLNEVAQVEHLELQKREVSEAGERLGLIRRQLEQVTKLIDLKSTRLFALRNEVDNQEYLPASDYDFRDFREFGDFGESNSSSIAIEELLKERTQVLGREFSKRPLFWIVLGLATLLVFSLLLWLMLRRSRSRNRRARIKMMRNLHQDQVPTVSSSRPLIFDEKEDELSIPAKLASSVPSAVSREKRKPPPPRSNDGEGFLSDNLTNANLDLARAYVNMGEVASAKSLLQDVINTGTDIEKAQAGRLLDEIK